MPDARLADARLIVLEVPDTRLADANSIPGLGASFFAHGLY